MTTQISTCPIWGENYKAEGFYVPQDRMMYVDNSPRAGGAYIIPEVLVNSDIENMDYAQKARLTTWLVEQRCQGVNQPVITEDVVAYTNNKRPLPVHERADRLLRSLAEKATTVGTNVGVYYNDPSMLAWSELISRNEVLFLLQYLKKKIWITGIEYMDSFTGVVTVEGHGRIADQATNVVPSQGFVAMWFDDSMTTAYRDGIEPGIKDAGYKPFRVDRKEHINKIEDEIIAEIRRSRFIVADFTQGDSGPRGGVYYEAGFAHGLGLQVIFTCKEGDVDKLHFDTNHYNHIFWSTPADLREKLKNRILAVIGEGPVAPKLVSGEVGGNTNGEIPA